MRDNPKEQSCGSYLGIYILFSIQTCSDGVQDRSTPLIQHHDHPRSLSQRRQSASRDFKAFQWRCQMLLACGFATKLPLMEKLKARANKAFVSSKDLPQHPAEQSHPLVAASKRQKNLPLDTRQGSVPKRLLSLDVI